MSSSDSKQTQNITQVDNRRTIGEKAISAENSTVNVVNNTLDAEVINKALEANGLAIDRVINFGNNALNFGSGAIKESFDFGKDSLSFADAQAARTNTAMANAYSDAMAVSENSLSKAYTFGTNALDRAFGTLADSQAMVATAYADAKGRGALTDKILMGAIAATALVAWAAVGKK